MARYTVRIVRDVVIPLYAIAFDEGMIATVQAAGEQAAAAKYRGNPKYVITTTVHGEIGEKFEQEFGYVNVEAENEVDALTNADVEIAKHFSKGQNVRAVDVSLESSEA